MNFLGTTMKKTEVIGWGVTILLIAISMLLPEGEIVTHQVKVFLAITVGYLSLAAFECVPIVFISIGLPATYVLFNVASKNAVFSPWVGTTMIMIFGAFLMAASLDASGLLKRVAFWMMCKVKGNYFALLFGIMIVGIILNILTSGRGYLIMGALGAGLCMSLNAIGTRLGVGIGTAVLIGTCQSHAYTYQVSGWSVIMKMSEGILEATDITPISIIMHNIPLLLVSCLTLFIIAKWYKPEDGIGEVTYFQEELKKLGAITKREKANAIMLICLLTYIFTVQWHGLDINLGFAMIPMMVFLPGFNAADANVVKKVDWSVVLFVAACMSIGTVATELGLGTALVDIMKGWLHGATSPIMLMALIFFVVFLLNFLMTPAAIISMIIAPVLLLAQEMGFNPIAFAYAVNACSEAILFPYEYVPYLVVYSFGMLGMKDFIKINSLRSVIFFAGFLAILVPWWMLIGVV